VDAIAAVLERGSRETRLHVCAELLSRTRGVLETWLSGSLSTEEAVEALGAMLEPESGVLHRLPQAR
jgi:hypothetical protein